MLVCVFLHNFAHETAGAARIRLSLRPLFLEGKEISSKPRAHRAARSRMYAHWSPLPPRALARGGEGSGVGGLSACSSGSEFAEAPHPRPLRASFARLDPAASRGQGREDDPAASVER